MHEEDIFDGFSIALPSYCQWPNEFSRYLRVFFIYLFGIISLHPNLSDAVNTVQTWFPADSNLFKLKSLGNEIKENAMKSAKEDIAESF